MADSINLEVPIRVTGPDGSILWQGTGIFGVVQAFKNSTVAVTESNVVVIDPATTVIPSSNSTVSGVNAFAAGVYAVKPSNTTGSLDRGIVGAALNTAAANTAQAISSTSAVANYVAVAGPGSLCMVTTASATGTIGRHLICGATNGTVTDTATSPPTTNPAQSPGYTVKPSGTTGGATDTGTATRLGAYIAVH